MTRTRFLIVLFLALSVAAALIILSSALSDSVPKSYNGATLVSARCADTSPQSRESLI